MGQDLSKYNQSVLEKFIISAISWQLLPTDTLTQQNLRRYQLQVLLMTPQRILQYSKGSGFFPQTKCHRRLVIPKQALQREHLQQPLAYNEIKTMMVMNYNWLTILTILMKKIKIVPFVDPTFNVENLVFECPRSPCSLVVGYSNNVFQSIRDTMEGTCYSCQTSAKKDSLIHCCLAFRQTTVIQVASSYSSRTSLLF